MVVYAFEGGELIVERQIVEKRTERDDDERKCFTERERPHVPLMGRHTTPHIFRQRAYLVVELRQHGRTGVERGDRNSGVRDWNRDAPCTGA